MSDTMLAAVQHNFGDRLSIEEVPIPEPGQYQALVKVDYTGVCHTDLHAVEGDWPVKPNLPLIPGHEGHGTVVSVGPDVTNVKVGDRVGNAWLWSACGECRYCLAGDENLCPKVVNGGYAVPGSFAEYMVVDSRYVGKIPDGVDPIEIAPILCAGVTVYRGLKSTDAKAGDWVTISGIGGLGHLAVQYAVAMGFNVAAVDVADEKLKLAKDLGASITVNAREQDPVEVLQNELGGTEGVLVTAPSNIAFEQAMHIVGRGGTVAINGLPVGDFPVNIFDTVLRGITLRGSIVGTRLDLANALDFAARDKVHTIATERPLSEINDVFDEMRTGKITGRVVLNIKDARAQLA
ncbi:alcohol dehydrogenase AdhP [Pseudoclavibacter sp. 13-3]|uniref:alcohol dehydrogenase AdhP n=1 Tax=Pseudoclavibacter sp. 13-3 TaxID=2901228 RepID=UPI001E2B26FE|nr:alcohol dehydrogenase AdhP [Pseudoclavibacter sp. 13-3]MCD7101528.1 alcohol dehydrogenase AdhP [Pseudoclavibacter sp. 13-3]